MCEPEHRAETSNHFQTTDSQWSNWGVRCLVRRRDPQRRIKETKWSFDEAKQRVDGLKSIFETSKHAVGASDYRAEG